MIDQIIEYVKQQITTNQFFSTAMFVSVVTALGFYLKDIPSRLWTMLKRRFVFTATIYDNDQIFYDFEAWFFKNHSKTYRSVEATTSFNMSQGFEPNSNQDVLHLKQNTGIYFIKYKGRYIYIDKTKDKLDKAMDIKSVFLNQYKISSWFGKATITSLLEEVIRERVDKIKEQEVSIYSHSQWGEWYFESNISSKKLDNIILPANIKEAIANDIQTFVDSEEWYAQASIDYKRGYLFYGDPGNGKTSLCKALAREFRKNLYVMDLNSFKENDNLRNAFRSIKPNSILLIEDIDSAFVQRTTGEDENKITFSTILNCLDGVYHKHGLIVFITTNHIEKMDGALLRKGRLDFKQEILNPSKREVEEYLHKFYGEVILLDNYSRNIPMCDIQSMCMDNKNSAKVAVKELTTSDLKLKVV